MLRVSTTVSDALEVIGVSGGAVSDQPDATPPLERMANRPSVESVSPRGLLPTKILVPAGAAILPLGRTASVG